LKAFIKSNAQKIVKKTGYLTNIPVSKKEKFKLLITNLLSILAKKYKNIKKKMNFILNEILFLSSIIPKIKKENNIKINEIY